MDYPVVFAVFMSVVATSYGTPLDDYVNRFDPHYGYTLLSSERGLNWTTFNLNMTSQKWKTESVTDRPIWWHYMTISIPDKVLFPDKAFLFISGGSNKKRSTEPDLYPEIMEFLASTMGMVTAYLGMIPNQPIVFKADPEKRRRREDAAVAWTWKAYMENTSDPEILIRMPMTKAAVRAMDTISMFAYDKRNLPIKSFIVSGASKRGWTTWTTAAIDKRVIGIIPIVLDLLNVKKNLKHQFRSYGGWTFAFGEYYILNITQRLDDPEFQKMMDIIDAYEYRSRLTIPKLIVSSAGDEFFLTDDANYYFSDLLGPKYLRIQPNAEHSCAGHYIDLIGNIRAFCLSLAKNWKMPIMSWKKHQNDSGGSITVYTDQTPVSIKSFHATTLDNKRRDFRLFVKSDDPSVKKPVFHPVFWHSSDVEKLENGVYQANFTKPDNGRWLGSFVQVDFAGPDGTVLEFTTEAMILPNTFPFKDCHGAGCHGTLV